MTVQYLPHNATDSFSKLVIDYLAGNENLIPFFRFTPDEKGIEAALNERSRYPVDREVLTNCLSEQYEGLAVPTKVSENIRALAADNTFTVCTAHQPNLMTGYLYFFYKIIHAIRLAAFLQEKFPGKKFVPVYYMGSEDNDLDELGVFNYEGKRFHWETTQTGAVGRMSTKDLHSLIESLKRQLGPPGEHTARLREIITAAYEQQPTIAAATRYLINELLGHYGIVVLDADAAALKKSFINVIQKELVSPVSFDIVTRTSRTLSQNYATQAYARPINLFYLKDHLRERIEHRDGKWQVLNTEIGWTEPELLTELNNHPERFSPNVILRGAYQESILPNVAFIGGGSEIAYWMQLKDLFHHYHIFFPTLILRQSALWLNPEVASLQSKIGLSDEALFLAADVLKSEYAARHSPVDISLQEERSRLSDIARQLSRKATAVDATLEASAAAAVSKIEYQFSKMEKKMLRGVKRRLEDQLSRIDRLKELLFPDGVLQERHDCFLEYYIKMGSSFFEEVQRHTRPFGDRFLLIKSPHP